MWILIIMIPLLFVGSNWWLNNPPPIGGPMEVPEYVEIRNCEFVSDDSVTFTILNVGNESVKPVAANLPVSLLLAQINGETATLEPHGFGAGTIPIHTSANFTVTLQDQTHFNSSETYEFKLMTTKGNIISYNGTYNLI